MVWISLDPSSSTGYAIYNNDSLIDYGIIKCDIKDYNTNISSYTQLPPNYPNNLLISAETMCREIFKLIKEHKIEKVFIEHTEQSTSGRFSQKYLEWLHLLITQNCRKNKLSMLYLLNSDWKKATNCYLKHWPEFIKHNKEVKKAKISATPTKSGAMVAKINGKIVSKVDSKKLSVHVANLTYDLNLILSENDAADALCLGLAVIKLGLNKI